MTQANTGRINFKRGLLYMTCGLIVAHIVLGVVVWAMYQTLHL